MQLNENPPRPGQRLLLVNVNIYVIFAVVKSYVGGKKRKIKKEKKN